MLESLPATSDRGSIPQYRKTQRANFYKTFKIDYRRILYWEFLKDFKNYFKINFKMFTILNNYENLNQNNYYFILHQSKWLRSPKQPTANAGKNVRKRKFSFTAGEITNCYSHSENQYWELNKLNLNTSYDSDVPPLGTWSKDFAFYSLWNVLFPVLHYSWAI